MSPSPVPAEDAATVILVRDHLPRGIELLLIARPTRSRFAAGQYVFPGGRIEEQDWAPGVEAFCRGLTREDAAARLNDVSQPRRAIGFWVGAIREAFEEAGLLLAYDRTGRLLGREGQASERIRGLRQACLEGALGFGDLLRDEGLSLATDGLHYFSHWITPEERKIRYDTRFFVAAAPPDQEIVLDPKEATAFRWVGPEEALAAQARGQLPMHFPTIRDVRALAGHASAADLLAAADGKVVETIMPRIVGGRILMPGEAGYY